MCVAIVNQYFVRIFPMHIGFIRQDWRHSVLNECVICFQIRKHAIFSILLHLYVRMSIDDNVYFLLHIAKCIEQWRKERIIHWKFTEIVHVASFIIYFYCLSQVFNSSNYLIKTGWLASIITASPRHRHIVPSMHNGVITLAF